MSKYILRLDDACPYRDKEKWDKVEKICDDFKIKPLVGIIPNCKDSELLAYPFDSTFWDETIKRWKIKGWEFALHGYEHLFCSNSGGINPVNYKSEFANLDYNEQKDKIYKGYHLLKDKGIETKVFFAPAHTYDLNTIIALKNSTPIRVISDNPAINIYSKYGITFVPQQSGVVRKLPFNYVTFCYHPNKMTENDFIKLQSFIKKHHSDFIPFPTNQITKKQSFLSILFSKIYYFKHKKGKKCHK